MKANIVDLRYKMKEVLKAIDRKERVEIVYRGRRKATIVPVHESSKKSVMEHPFFGSQAKDRKSVEHVMEELRGGRYRDI